MSCADGRGALVVDACDQDHPLQCCEVMPCCGGDRTLGVSDESGAAHLAPCPGCLCCTAMHVRTLTACRDIVRDALKRGATPGEVDLLLCGLLSEGDEVAP